MRLAEGLLSGVTTLVGIIETGAKQVSGVPDQLKVEGLPLGVDILPVKVKVGFDAAGLSTLVTVKEVEKEAGFEVSGVPVQLIVEEGLVGVAGLGLVELEIGLLWGVAPQSVKSVVKVVVHDDDMIPEGVCRISRRVNEQGYRKSGVNERPGEIEVRTSFIHNLSEKLCSKVQS